MNLEQMLFSRVAEEAAEIAQAAIKCVRFTPNHAYDNVSNVEALKLELADLAGILRLLETIGALTIDQPERQVQIERRIEKELKYLKISKELGTLSDYNILIETLK